MAAALLALAPLLAGCSAGGNSQDTFFHAIDGVPYTSLDPSAEQAEGICVMRNVYETLTVYDDATGEVKPCLAESWSSNAIMSEWTFKLRKDVLFHDGSRLTAAAVRDSIERTIRLNEGAAYIWDCVDSIEAEGESTVKFRLKYAAALPLIASSGSAAYIMSPASTGRDEAWFNAGNDGGSGPYRIAAVARSSVSLEAFMSYRGDWGKGRYRKVFVQEVPDRERRTGYLESGEADIVSFPDVDRMAKLAGSSLKVNTSWRSVIMMFNTAITPCLNRNFRKALAYAFPFGETVNRTLRGRATRSSGMMPPGMWAHDEDLPSYTQDLDKARDFLKTSGLKGTAVKISYQAGRDDLDLTMEQFCRNLEEIGLVPILLKVDWDAQQRMAVNPSPDARQSVLVMDWWPDYADPAGTFRPLLSNQGLDKGFNYSYISDPYIEQSLNQAEMKTLQNQKEAAEIYAKIQKKVLDECYLLFLYDSAIPLGVKTSLSGVRINPAYESAIYYYDITR